MQRPFVQLNWLGKHFLAENNHSSQLSVQPWEWLTDREDVNHLVITNIYIYRKNGIMQQKAAESKNNKRFQTLSDDDIAKLLTKKGSKIYNWFNEGCFGHWDLRTGKLSFWGHSCRTLQWVLYTLACGNFQWPRPRASCCKICIHLLRSRSRRCYTRGWFVWRNQANYSNDSDVNDSALARKKSPLARMW